MGSKEACMHGGRGDMHAWDPQSHRLPRQVFGRSFARPGVEDGHVVSLKFRQGHPKNTEDFLGGSAL
eukprot:362768-Chlamydomonas_euryale.AAC.4